MVDFLFQLNALTVFLLITAAGFLFLLASFLLGDLFDMLGHDAGGDAHDMGILDTRVISIFATAFGGCGALGTWLGVGVVLSSVLGLVGGIALGAIIFFFGQTLYRQQASSSISAHSLVGRIAEVVVAIHPNSVGKISCRVGEERVEKLARSRENVEIKPGAFVLIEEVAKEMVIVSFDEEVAKLYLPPNS